MGRAIGGCRALTADGFRRVVKCHLRRIRDAVLTVRAENATKKGLYDTRKAAVIQCPTPSYSPSAPSTSTHQMQGEPCPGCDPRATNSPRVVPA